MFLEVVAGYEFMTVAGLPVSSIANSYRFCEDHHDAWSSSSEAVKCRLALASNATGGPGAWPFMDFLTTGGAGCATGSHCPGMSNDEYKTDFVLWALTQSPLLVATDVRNMTPVMEKALLNGPLLSIHQSTITPPGKLLGRWTCTEPLDCQIWGRKLNADGGEWLVALVNRGSKAHSITASWHLLGWGGSSMAMVRDLWSHADLPNATGAGVSAEVPSHGTAVLRVILVDQV
jgi:alpha-galactosidase